MLYLSKVKEVRVGGRYWVEASIGSDKTLVMVEVLHLFTNRSRLEMVEIEVVSGDHTCIYVNRSALLERVTQEEYKKRNQ